MGGKFKEIREKRKIQKVAVGLSGGVDSSLSAALLVEAGYQVTGVFLECWRAPGCRVVEDRKDALDVALQLGIPYKVLDFKKEYKERVVDYFYREYEAGRTPNPDTMCNREIKFGLFYEWAMENGFDAVATGHYARVKARNSNDETRNKSKTQNTNVLNIGNLGEQAGHYERMVDAQVTSNKKPTFAKASVGRQETKILKQVQDDEDDYFLQRGADEKKDQSYFLYQLRPEQLPHILFPIGGMKKSEVRAEAKKRDLKTASKPDSQGICFIGDIDVQGFLRERIEEKEGEILIKVTRSKTQETNKLQTAKPKSEDSIASLQNDNALVVGKHPGAAFYTIGQKVGKEIDQARLARLAKKGMIEVDPSEMPHLFVVEKDVERNILVVGFEEELKVSEFEVERVGWMVGEEILKLVQVDGCFVRIRNLGELVEAEVKSEKEKGKSTTQKSKVLVKTVKPLRAVAEGQACVFYSDSSVDAVVLGGGVIV